MQNSCSSDSTKVGSLAKSRPLGRSAMSHNVTPARSGELISSCFWSIVRSTTKYLR